jgi:hypothetical protein
MTELLYILIAGEASNAWAQDNYSHSIGRSSWVGIGYQRCALDYRSLDNGYCVSSYPGFLFIRPDDRPNNSLGLAVGIPGYLSLTLHEWGRLGRKALGDVATAALPDTILGWYREAPRALDGSKYRGPGRPQGNRI